MSLQPVRMAGFGRRLTAYAIDIIPIVLLTATVCYLFFGLDQALRAYLDSPGNHAARIQFLEGRNQVRDGAFVVWLLYSLLMEASVLQGTLGKRVMGIRVVGPDGKRLTLARSARRNLGKLLAYGSFGVSFLWVVFSRRKRAWHDTIANTDVVHDEVARDDTTH